MALVVGVGNRARGDDGVGPEVAARVAALGLRAVRVVVEDEPLHLVEHIAEHDDVVVVDAVRPEGNPGRLSLLVVDGEPLPRRSALGSHGLGVVDAVELARALGRLPARLTLVGVEAQALTCGAPLSAPVRDRVDDAVHAVLSAIRPDRAGGTPT